mgnify:FL=1
MLVVYHPGQRAQVGKDVSRTCCFLATHQSCSKLTDWHHQVYVVTANVVLRHVDDGLLQTHLSVVVR